MQVGIFKSNISFSIWFKYCDVINENCINPGVCQYWQTSGLIQG